MPIKSDLKKLLIMPPEQIFLCALVIASAKKGTPFTIRDCDARSMMDQLLCFEARVEQIRLRNGLITADERRRLVQAASSLNSLPIYIESPDEADFWKE